MLSGSLDQPRRKAGFCKDDPDRRHCWRAWTEVKREFDVFFRKVCGLQVLLADLCIDGSVVNRTWKIDRVKVDIFVFVAALIFQPSTEPATAFKVVIGQQVDPIKARLTLQSRCYRTDILTKLTL